MLPSGVPLVDGLAERDYALRLRTPYVAIADAASSMQSRYMRSEIHVVRTIDPAELRGVGALQRANVP